MAAGESLFLPVHICATGASATPAAEADVGESAATPSASAECASGASATPGAEADVGESAATPTASAEADVGTDATPKLRDSSFTRSSFAWMRT